MPTRSLFLSSARKDTTALDPPQQASCRTGRAQWPLLKCKSLSLSSKFACLKQRRFVGMSSPSADVGAIWTWRALPARLVCLLSQKSRDIQVLQRRLSFGRFRRPAAPVANNRRGIEVLVVKRAGPGAHHLIGLLALLSLP